MLEKFKPLTAEQMRNVIEGKGSVERVPAFIHFWTFPEDFQDGKRQEVERVLASYPQDAQVINYRMPQVFTAPQDNPSYRWCYKDAEPGRTPDNSGFIMNWDEELEPFLQDFPSPEYPGLIPPSPEKDGRYRLGIWWYLLFERFWSIRGMENALIDFYENPDAVHALFRKLTDFYKRMIERGKFELGLDGVFTSDDLGTQTSTFFSTKIFDEFFAPYYHEIVEKAHSLDMHFWLHTCGNVASFIPKFIDVGIDVLHPIQKYTMNEKEIAAKFGNDITIWAGFDVQQIIPYGTPDDVRREVRYLIDTYARRDGRFMFTLGNRTTSDTPPESLEALLSELFLYGSEKMNKLKN